MSSVSRDRDYRYLETEVSGYTDLLASLETRFETWEEVFQFVREGRLRHARTDEVLQPLFERYTQYPDPRWRSVLLTIFWSELLVIHQRRKHWDRDPEELWSNVYWVFLRVIDKIDPHQRHARLGQKILNDTQYHLHQAYQREWKHSAREMTTRDGVIQNGRQGIEFTEVDLRLDKGAEANEVHRHVRTGLISEVDFLIIVGTRIYREPLRDIAGQVNLSYEAARKRRQRAEHLIREKG